MAEPAKEGEGALGIHLSLLDGKYYLYSYIEEFDEETYESNYIDEWRGFDGEAIDVLKRNVCEIVFCAIRIEIYQFSKTQPF